MRSATTLAAADAPDRVYSTALLDVIGPGRARSHRLVRALATTAHRVAHPAGPGEALDGEPVPDPRSALQDRTRDLALRPVGDQRGRALSGPAFHDRSVTLDDALEALAAVDERKARAVELHYFGGLSQKEIAAALSVHENTVARDLRLAHAWLYRRMTEAAQDDGTP